MLCYFMQLALKMCKFLHNACQTEVMFMNVIIELITRGRWVQNFSSFWWIYKVRGKWGGVWTVSQGMAHACWLS